MLDPQCVTVEVEWRFHESVDGWFVHEQIRGASHSVQYGPMPRDQIDGFVQERRSEIVEAYEREARDRLGLVS